MSYRQVALQCGEKRPKSHYLATKGGENKYGTAGFFEYWLAKIMEFENGPVEVQGIALVSVDDISGINAPSGLELSQILFCQHIA